MSAYDLFLASAGRHANRLAVVDRRGHWTYSALAARVDDIAREIKHRCLPPASRVGLALSRTADAVAAVLAVWKCGMIYVPVDTATPAARADALFCNSAVRLVLTDGTTAPERLADRDQLDLRLVKATSGTAHAIDSSADIEQQARAGNNIAYVMYTSGTTAQPKGVMIDHRAIINLARAHRERIYRYYEHDDRGLRASFGASLAFDGAVERILLLLYGHVLHMLGDDERADPEKYIHYASEHGLEALDLTPAFLKVLVEYGLLTRGTWRPRLGLVGGEAIPKQLWGTLAASGIPFFNVYGPTETTVNASVGQITNDTPHLGRALANTQLYVLKPDNSRASVDEEGEIHIAGVGVGLGYDGMPALTATKFKPNAFAGADPSYQRIYATGDRGRFQLDGTLEFLGRIDEQIKLRGFRIEPDEITTLLCRHPDVADALVRVRESSDGENQALVAYVASSTQQHDALSSQLRALLRARLPSYMVPSRIVTMGRFPLTGTGKLNDAALAALDDRDVAPQQPDPSLDGILPALIAIWEDVLHTSAIEPHVSFFELGGESLSAVAMVRRVNQKFKLNVPIATVVTAPTITSFDSALRDALRLESGSHR
jgi:amino acid adenylation domain-containing protein